MKYMLVYQGQNAHVVRVSRLSYAPEKRESAVVFTGSHAEAVKYATRMLNRGCGVKTGHTDEPGDITDGHWVKGPGEPGRHVVTSRDKKNGRPTPWINPVAGPAPRPEPPPRGKKQRGPKPNIKGQTRRWVDYNAYLKSKDWQRQRQAALSRAGRRCQVCNDYGLLDVHHRTYARLGCELAADLIVLCRSCHDLFHSNGKLAEK